MRTLATFLGLMTLAVPLPAAADFLLNCHLIDSGNPVYRQHCKTESRYLVVNECAPSRICVTKKQNFKGVFSGSVGLSANGIPIALSNVNKAAVSASGQLTIATGDNVTGTVNSSSSLSVTTSTSLGSRSLTGSAGAVGGVTQTAGGVVSSAGGLLK